MRLESCILDKFRSELVNIIVVNSIKISNFFNGPAIEFEDFFDSFFQFLGVFSYFSPIVFYTPQFPGEKDIRSAANNVCLLIDFEAWICEIAH